MMIDFHGARNILLARLGQGWTGLDFVKSYSDLMDDYLKGLYQNSIGSNDEPQGLALVALGGYGRGKLAPFSDVDLLFLTSGSFDAKKGKGLIEKILYPLWDLRLEVGHAVRTPAQCLEMAHSDFASLSTQLDGRFLIGDHELFKEFERKFHRWLSARSRRHGFYRNLKTSVEERHHKYGASPYLLEPNVKMGQGALRDIHAIYWAISGLYDLKNLQELVGRGFLSQERVDEVEKSQAFITDVRVRLHIKAEQKSDTLTFDLQEDIANWLGFEDDGHVSGVELFMQRFYTHVYQTKSALSYFMSRVEGDLVAARDWKATQQPRMVEKGLSILRGFIELGTRAEVRQRPYLLMRAFEVSSASGLPISQRSLEMTRTNLDLVDDEFRRDPKVAESFFKGLTAIPPRNNHTINNFDAIDVLPLLDVYIPELSGVKARVQHDAYHVYTVDIHLVLTLWELKKIGAGLVEEDEGVFEAGILEQVRDKRILFLAALVHDIGKGHGHDHARLGAEMVPPLGRRLGFSEADIETLSFLIREHLYLPEIALRRDLTEEKLIVKCARHVGDPDRLNMLYLLTVADSRATGPGAMSPWKASLLKDLYAKIHTVLTKSDLALKETARRTDQLIKDVFSSLEEKMTLDEVDAHMEKMSVYYLTTMTVDQVVRHILMEKRLKKGDLIWEVDDREEGYCEVTILTNDRPGLLSRMAGIFTLHNINILGAQVFTRANDLALDIFQVEPPPDRVYASEAWKRVEEDARRALTGHIALDYRLSRKQPLLGVKKVVTREPDRVVVDNDISDFYTIVEVYTYDRLGLLYKVTKALYDLQLSINIAKISTKVDQVVDVFYVRDFVGQKLYDRDQLRELKEALYFTLSTNGS